LQQTLLRNNRGTTPFTRRRLGRTGKPVAMEFQILRYKKWGSEGTDEDPIVYRNISTHMCHFEPFFSEAISDSM
jgi:hypothetical protein